MELRGRNIDGPRVARIFLGAAFWIFVFSSIGVYALGPGAERTSAAQRKLTNYWFGSRASQEIAFATPTELGVGDPVFFLANGEDQPRLIGEIARLGGPVSPVRARLASVQEASISWYPHTDAPNSGAKFEYLASPQSLAWVAQTLMPGERREQIMAELRKAMDSHQAENAAAMGPIVEDTLRAAYAIVERDLAKAIDHNREALRALGERYQKEIVQDELAPLIKTEVVPILREEASPVVRAVGRELWDRASLWRFGWRFLYDSTPLPEKKLVEREWDRFVDTEAIPVFESHAEEFAKTARTIVQRLLDNKKIDATLREQFARVIDDPEFRSALGKILREVFVDNAELKAMFRDQWTSPRAVAAFNLASDRLEPTVRRVADMVLGKREEGITPEFAQVLRSQILRKERRWILVTETAGGESVTTRSPPVVQVQPHSGSVVNPFVERLERSRDAARDRMKRS